MNYDEYSILNPYAYNDLSAGKVRYIQTINAFIGLFEAQEWPEYLDLKAFLKKILHRGYIVIIVVGGKLMPVRVNVQRWNYDLTKILKATINEPYLQFLHGKDIDKFKHFTISINSFNLGFFNLLKDLIIDMDNNRYFKNNHLASLSSVVNLKDSITRTPEERRALENAAGRLMTNGNPVKTLTANVNGNEVSGDYEILDINDKSDAFFNNEMRIFQEWDARIGVINTNEHNQTERLLNSQIDVNSIKETSLIISMLKYINEYFDDVNKEVGTKIKFRVNHFIYNENNESNQVNNKEDKNE